MFRRSLLILAALPAMAADSRLPPMRPQVQGVYPHGGQRGTSVEVTIRGRELQGASEIRFATPKLSAEILAAEHNQVRARFHLDSAAEPGRTDFRLIAPHGSTLAWFEVGARAETFEKEPNNDIARAQPLDMSRVTNGVIKGGDYDYFKFVARAGQILTFDINATRTGSPLDPVLGLLDESGAEIAYSDDYYQFKDAHIVHTFGATGTYFLRVYGTGESGSDLSDYRLTAGAMPHVDHAMPMGGRRGQPVEVRLSGVNLSGIESVVLGDGLAAAQILSRSEKSATIRLTVPKDAPNGVHRLHVANATQPVPFVISDYDQVAVAGETARRKEDPYPVTLPVVANGVIDKPKAAHYFSFRVDEPASVVLTADAQQLNFLLDPLIVVYDESGKRIAYQDESTTNTGREPVNMDPHLTVRLPKAGRYTAMIRDAAFRGDPAYAYRLTMKRAEPDFSIKVVGTDETLYRGIENTVTIRLRRMEGWDAPVEIWAEDLPEGVTAGRIVSKIENLPYRNTCGEEHFLDGTKVEIPIQVAAGAALTRHEIKFRARGVMNGRVVEREGYTRYWWRVNQKIIGDAQTGRMLATVADFPLIFMNTPARVGVAKGKPGSVKVIFTRLDNGDAPLEITAEAPEGVRVETATVPASATVAELKITSPVEKQATITLVGRSGGKVLGKSHPIIIAPSSGSSEQQPADSDEN